MASSFCKTLNASISTLDVCELGCPGNDIKGNRVELFNDADILYIFKSISRS